MAQRPVEHVAVALGREHAVPHAPQFETSEPRLVSHPFAIIASQSAKPALHAAMSQRPLMHAGVPFEALHRMPQPAQFVGSLRVLTSQPLLASPSQSAHPSSQAITAQRPAPHAPVA